MWLLLAALALRAVVPVGWMPAEDGSFVICTLEGAKRVIIGADGKPHDAPQKDPREKAMHGLCHFAGTYAGPLPSSLASLHTPGFVQAQPRLAQAFTLPATSQLRLAAPRGPPSLIKHS